MSESLPQRVAAAVRAVVGGTGFVALHEPTLAGREWEYVKDCLDTKWVSSAGKYVDRLEGMLCELTGATRAVAVVNGTAGLHAALVACGVRRGDEVLLPALTFVATASAVHHAGAVPHFVDSETRTLGVDPEALSQHLADCVRIESGHAINRRTERRVVALVVVHLLGHPALMDALVEIAERYHLALIEDAAESIGSVYRGRHTGTIGRLGVTSFNGNKTITTGGGGAILTNDAELGARLKHLTTTARVPHEWRYYHDEAGFNYRMPNINAALGCAQLEQLPELLRKKALLHGRYVDQLAPIRGVSLLEPVEGCISNHWLNTLRLDRPDVQLRDAIVQAGAEVGLMMRPPWELMHTLPSYRDAPRADLQTAEHLAASLVSVPSSAHLVDA